MGVSAPEASDQGLAFLRKVDQHIALGHAERLRYPPELLARGVAFALSGDPPKSAATRAVTESSTKISVEGAVAAYRKHLAATPHLRIGVVEGLAQIDQMGVSIVVVTEDAAERCQSILRTHKIDSFVSEIVSMRKTATSFRQLKSRLAEPRVFMVGDQLDRDVAPAAESGCRTIYFPSEFSPFWIHGIRTRADFVIHRYDEIVQILKRSDAPGSSPLQRSS
jgi:putative hydrolase of the HAD superfamily